MIKVVVCDHIHEKGLNILRGANDISLLEAQSYPKDKLLEMIADAEVAITRSSTDVDEKFLEAAKSIKAIVRAGVGVDNVDIDGCSKRGVIVMNVPTANTIAAVELTLAHMLSCMRAFPYAHAELKDGRVWKRENWYGRELCGKKLGIIGFGNIGSRVGTRALSFGMEVIAFDPYIKPSKATDVGVAYAKNFDEIFDCDIITIHTPKNKETVNMIGAKEIAKMKDGVVLINCARGGLFNEDELYEALVSKKVSFAGIDVFTKEPATNNKLLDLPNVTVTPHLGANTQESQEKIAIEAAEQALSAARGSSFPNALNLPIKLESVPSWAMPYFELTQKIAFLASQINKGALESIKVKASGEIAEYLEPLTTFATVGAAKEAVGENVNYINAAFLAKDRGIAVEAVEEKKETTYKNKVAVKLTTNEEITVIAATMFDEGVSRIVNINGFEIDVEPKGKMIFFKNSDVPGVIGEVGTLLGQQNINIADFRLSRNEKKEALALIIVDNDVSEDVLNKLRALKAAISVKYAIL